jgi:hypothetical protein
MPGGIVNREADNWLALLAVADAAGGEWPARARRAAEQAHIAAADDEASRLELLLGDIRAAFAEKGATVHDLHGSERTEITSAALVAFLVALDGRPWAEMGRAHKPLTANRLARMLRVLKPPVAPQKVGPKDERVSGYVQEEFKDAFEHYLAPEGDSQPDNRTPCDEIRISCDSKPDTTESGCPVAKCEKLNNDGLVSGCPVVNRGAGADEPGLSRRRIRDLAEQYQERAYANAQENEGDTGTAELDADLRRRLAEMVLPESVEVEFKRVMAEVFRV